MQYVNSLKENMQYKQHQTKPSKVYRYNEFYLSDGRRIKNTINNKTYITFIK